MVGEERKPGISDGVIALGQLAAIGQGIALIWRRSHPEIVVAIALLGGLVIHLLAPDGQIPVSGLFAVGSLAAVRPPRVSLLGLTLLLGLAALNFWTAPTGDALFVVALAVAAWALGEAGRTRKVAIEQGARRAVADEQARIARELHDVIAHSVSVIVVQAGAADDVFDAQPERARAALRSIDATGRDALRELRRLLGAVRPEAENGVTQPQPGLARLDELVAPLREAGLEVSVERRGEPAGVSAGVDLSAYRIVQEALTNTLRHAGATRADVWVSYSPERLELEVRDDGHGGDGIAGAGGHGLIGMRERATMVGGTVEAGPLAEGGFRVHARLPLEPVR